MQRWRTKTAATCRTSLSSTKLTGNAAGLLSHAKPDFWCDGLSIAVRALESFRVCCLNDDHVGHAWWFQLCEQFRRYGGPGQTTYSLYAKWRPYVESHVVSHSSVQCSILQVRREEYGGWQEQETTPSQVVDLELRPLLRSSGDEGCCSLLRHPPCHPHSRALASAADADR